MAENVKYAICTSFEYESGYYRDSQRDCINYELYLGFDIFDEGNYEHFAISEGHAYAHNVRNLNLHKMVSGQPVLFDIEYPYSVIKCISYNDIPDDILRRIVAQYTGELLGEIPSNEKIPNYARLQQIEQIINNPQFKKAIERLVEIKYEQIEGIDNISVRALAERMGIKLYNIDESFEENQQTTLDYVKKTYGIYLTEFSKEKTADRKKR